MWNALEGNAGGGSGMTGTSASSAAAAAASAMDPASLLMNTQLASALSLTGDAQYWEESISPSTIRQELAAADPSNPSSTPNILRGMKWLLASISKGRNVSDFYPHVVKLVGAVSLEVRKMVYMYLVQYADHDATTRELSLLSINAFQRGLADAEQWIRALALRVLTSIRIPDILQIQILGVQKCAQDKSPYVRKCAANALSKLYGRCESENMDDKEVAEQQQELLLQVCQDLLYYDQATMVLTSALIAWQELCPHKLEMLHGCFRKFCHLLTDMDEWGQVVVIDTFARYCRMYFAEPAGFRDGSAERIDRDRRVRRTIYGLESEQTFQSTELTNDVADGGVGGGTLEPSMADKAALAGVTLPPRSGPSKVKRRVVKKGFYSDEDDDSTEEEVYAESESGPPLPVASAMRQRNILGLPSSTENSPFVSSAMTGSTTGTTPAMPLQQQQQQDSEDGDLAEDHRLFLNAAMHLLKSRNAGVVLAVCSLQYYCGVSSIKVRAAVGKALVRIHRDRREIQYIVLASIRTLASECPSAFSPFLHDFFVKALDPPFTRIIKLDILTSLSLEPSAIDAVLQEMRTYVKHGDTKFATAAIRAVGRVVELARIVYDRHAARTDTEQRSQSDKIALNVLHGLLTLTQVRDRFNRDVIGEAVIVMRLILQLLQQETGGKGVSDPNNVQERSIQRMLLLSMKTLTARIAAQEEPDDHGGDDEDDDDDDETAEKAGSSALNGVVSAELPEQAHATAMWVIGEHLSEFSLTRSVKPFRDEATRSRIRLELIRMIAKAFSDLSPMEKEQGIHLASKLIISKQAGVHCLDGETPLCEQVLAMGRVDVNPDVRDRARFESSLLRSVSALKHDFDATEEFPLALGGEAEKSLTLEDSKRILLLKKPACSSLPVENHSNTHGSKSEGFRFGTLSSLVGHQARSAYIPLPPWAEKDSPSSLRSPPSDKKPKQDFVAAQDVVQPAMIGGFYKDDAENVDSDSSTSSDDSSSSESSDDDSSSSSDSSSDDSSTGKPSLPPTTDLMGAQSNVPHQQQTDVFAPTQTPQPVKVQTVGDDSSSDDSNSSSDDSDDDSSVDQKQAPQPTSTSASSNLIPNLMNNDGTGGGLNSMIHQNGNSASDDMKGLVLTPVVSDGGISANPDIERDSSGWTQLVRPEHTGGLSLSIRYLRGATKAQQAQLLGIAESEKKPNLVVLQLRIESQSSGANVFRRVKLLQRPISTSSSSVGPKKVYLPQEISQMKPGQQSECTLGIEFASASDRDDTLLAKLDFKFGSGGIPIEIKPSLGHVLLPCQRTSSQFDAEIRNLQGFERVETTIDARRNKEGIAKTILRAASLTVVGNGWKDDPMRLIGSLPASSTAVYVAITKNESTASCKVVVCSENAIAANSLMNLVKKSILS